MPGRPSQNCSLTATRTAFAPGQVAMAATMARVMVACGVSKIPQPSSQAYSAPELLNPISRTARPLALSIWWPDTCNPWTGRMTALPPVFQADEAPASTGTRMAPAASSSAPSTFAGAGPALIRNSFSSAERAFLGEQFVVYPMGIAFQGPVRSVRQHPVLPATVRGHFLAVGVARAHRHGPGGGR